MRCEAVVDCCVITLKRCTKSPDFEPIRVHLKTTQHYTQYNVPAPLERARERIIRASVVLPVSKAVIEYIEMRSLSISKCGH